MYAMKLMRMLAVLFAYLAVVTHYMEEADRLCDRIGIIDNGRLIALDTPCGLKSRVGDPDSTTLEEVFLNLTGRSLRD